MILVALLVLLQADEFTLSPDKNVIFKDDAFKIGSATPEPAFLATLSRFATYLQKRPDLCIEIGGHADSRGQPDANFRLSLARAEAVRKVLLEQNALSPDCLVVKGYGASRPLDASDTEAARVSNRRVEVLMLSRRSKTPLHRAAELSAVVRDVKTQAPWEIEQKKGHERDPLFELHRVTTAKGARAEVSFADESKLQIEENALVIVYGPSKEASAPKADDVRLMRGALLAKLQSMRGDELRVTTENTLVTMKPGRTKLGVDDKRRAVLSVHAGKSLVASEGSEVAVPSGFGTQVEIGKAPEAPRPLPAAPTLLAPLQEGAKLDANSKLTVRFEPTTKRTRVDIARDAAMNELATSQVVSGDQVALLVQPGRYFLQLTALDDLDLESSPVGPQRPISVSALPPETPLALQLSHEGPLDASDSIFSLTGSVSRSSAKVTINDEPMLLNTAGAFVHRTRLTVGDNTLEVVARDGTQVVVKRVNVRYTPKLTLRGGFELGPGVPISFSGETFGLLLAGQLGFVLKPWLMPIVRAGMLLLLGSPVQPAFFADAGVVFELPVNIVLRPYAEIDLGVFGFLNANYPEAASGRSRLAFAPALGIGGRLGYARVSFTLGAHYRLVLDSYTNKKVHGLVELRLGLAFE